MICSIRNKLSLFAKVPMFDIAASALAMAISPLSGFPMYMQWRIDCAPLGIACFFAIAYPRGFSILLCGKSRYRIFLIGFFCCICLAACSIWGHTEGLLPFCFAIGLSFFRAAFVFKGFSKVISCSMETTIASFAIWMLFASVCAALYSFFSSLILPINTGQLLNAGFLFLIFGIEIVLQRGKESNVGKSIDNYSFFVEKQNHIPVGLLVIQFVVLSVITACNIVSPSYPQTASALGFALGALMTFVVVFGTGEKRLLEIKKIVQVCSSICRAFARFYCIC